MKGRANNLWFGENPTLWEKVKNNEYFSLNLKRQKTATSTKHLRLPWRCQDSWRVPCSLRMRTTCCWRLFLLYMEFAPASCDHCSIVPVPWCFSSVFLLFIIDSRWRYLLLLLFISLFVVIVIVIGCVINIALLLLIFRTY